MDNELFMMVGTERRWFNRIADRITGQIIFHKTSLKSDSHTFLSSFTFTFTGHFSFIFVLDKNDFWQWEMRWFYKIGNHLLYDKSKIKAEPQAYYFRDLGNIIINSKILS